MSIVSFTEYKSKKELHAKALQYAQYYNTNIKDVMEVAAAETTVTRTISRKEAMEALSGTIITPSQLGIDTLEEDIDTSDVQVIQWNPDIPW